VSGSADISDNFIRQFVADCTNILRCNPLDLIAVTANESDCRTTAHNPNGHASGLWQFMPATLRGMGWSAADCDAGLSAFRQLDHLGQWLWFRRFFRPKAGLLVSRAACYVATFLPADIALAADPEAVLVEKGGRRGWAFMPNRGFDANGDLRITVRELDDAIARAARGPRWDDIFARVRAEMAAQAHHADDEPDTVVVDVGNIGNANHRAIEDLLEGRDDPDDVA